MKEGRGFAAVSQVKRREISSKGGKACHRKGTGHEWTSEEAREAGRKGGRASHRGYRGKPVSPSTTLSKVEAVLTALNTN